MAKKKGKLPKKIAGFKIFKEFRKHSKPLLRRVHTPQFRAMAATVASATMAALAAQLSSEKSSPTKKMKRRFWCLTAEGKDRAAEMTDSIGHAIVAAIQSQLAKERKELRTAH